MVRVVTVIIDFSDTLSTLLSTSDNKISVFVKYTHAINSAQSLNGKIMNPNKSSQDLNSLLFDMEDIELCG